ncbi:MAG: 23S rRNA (adenine(2503)-C(2))-methyltransferase RlmN [Anaerolineaceae bacterium]|nr:23S rRNA (adenine(2503)-C(2))-methyltransferase RlmN [Anaerolineaceae bacterium]
MKLISKPSLHNFTFDEFEQLLHTLNVKSYRLKQLWQGLYHQYWETFEDFSTIPKSLRRILKEKFTFDQLKPINIVTSQDGKTEKTLLELSDGKTIETVLMRYDTRNTICISTQVGCSMNCDFCATGQMGFHRNLSTAEIVKQVLFYAKQLKLTDEHLTNIVIMGMGEPFNNYENTMKAIDILNDSEGFKFSERRITISTVGIIRGIERFGNEHRQVNLAISLHAANDKLRNSLIPINRKYPLQELISACKEYLAKTRRRITFEYALIYGVNDSVNDAQELSRLLKGMLAHVNLMRLNATPGYKYSGSSKEKITLFKEILEQNYIPCSIRMKRGTEIAAGCGQLASKSQNSQTAINHE